MILLATVGCPAVDDEGSFTQSLHNCCMDCWLFWKIKLLLGELLILSCLGLVIILIIAEMKMKKYGLAVLLIISQLCSVLSVEPTGPAFMWSPHIDMELGGNVNYQVLSTKDLAKAVMSQGGWSDILCEGKIFQQSVDVAVVFVGKELRSSDISRNNFEDASLVHLLKDSFRSSNFSMAYPYVSAKVKEGTFENTLIEEFEDSCNHELRAGNILVTESCSMGDKEYSKLANMHSIKEYAASAVEKGSKGQTDLLVVCHKGFSSLKKLGQPDSEGDIFSELISALDLSGAKYAVLYASDPLSPIRYPSAHEIGRFLAEAPGNGSLNSTFCDGVCEIKKSLLEALFVTIVLLIILISGFCCMMGIDTPTRFEAPQESS